MKQATLQVFITASTTMWLMCDGWLDGRGSVLLSSGIREATLIPKQCKAVRCVRCLRGRGDVSKCISICVLVVRESWNLHLPQPFAFGDSADRTQKTVNAGHVWGERNAKGLEHRSKKGATCIRSKSAGKREHPAEQPPPPATRSQGRMYVPHQESNVPAGVHRAQTRGLSGEKLPVFERYLPPF
jgi:hypothetical protein